jgi:hypothetical protein
MKKTYTKKEKTRFGKKIINNMTRNIKTTKNVRQHKSHKIESYISKEHKRIGNKIITQTKKTREEQIK